MSDEQMNYEQRLAEARRRADTASVVARKARDASVAHVALAQEADYQALTAELGATRASNAAHNTRDPDMAEKLASEAEAYATPPNMVAGIIRGGR